MATTGHESEVVTVQGLKAAMKKGGNLGIFNKGTCGTAAATQAKTVTVGSGFTLVADAMLLVRFTYAITCENATLNVNSTGAKPIYNKGAALEADIIPAGALLQLCYNGTQYEIVGGVGDGQEMEGVLGIDSYDGNASYPDIDAVLDTVHTKAQTLTSQQKQTARTNIDVYSTAEVDQKTAKSYDHWYNEVEDTTGKNPAQEGWYELDDDEYVLTSDNSPVSGKTYYEQASYYVMTI